MNKENQEVYASPQVEVIEIKAQAVICTSIDPGNPFDGNTESNPWG